MQSYGFVYIWRDRKHKKLYIGCHWGHEQDGYVCSSTNMRNNYRNRPHDFRRRILQRVHTNRQDLLEAEHAWLSLIQPEQLGAKFYNKRNHKFRHWSTDANAQYVKGTITITDGIRERRVRPTEDVPHGWTRGRSLRTKAAIKQRKPPVSDDCKMRTSVRMREKFANDVEFKARFLASRPATVSDEARRKMSASKRGRPRPNPSAWQGHMWITNGVDSTRISKDENIPAGWRAGRTIMKGSY